MHAFYMHQVHRAKTLLCRFLEEEKKNSPSKPIPPEFDINPRVTLVGKIRLLQHYALGVPTNWYTHIVAIKNNFKATLPGIARS
jgi:hypothetical protein